MANLTRYALHITCSLAASIIPPSSPIASWKALLIGCNYGHVDPKARRTLKGPHREVMLMKNLLTERYGLDESNIIVMLDAPGIEPSREPTQENIKREVEQFLNPMVRGCQYVFLYCGHAEQKESESTAEALVDGDEEYEEDGKGEYIVPCDAMNKEGRVDEDKLIPDSFLRKYLANPLPPGCELLAIMDACHSNTLMNLKHSRCNRVHTTRSQGRRFARRVIELGNVIAQDVGSTVAAGIADLNGFFRRIVDPGYRPRICNGYCARLKVFLPNVSEARIVCVSACKDCQQTYDCGPSVTMVLINLLRDNPNPTLKELMRAISAEVREFRRKTRQKLHMKFDQSPQISSECPLDMTERLFAKLEPRPSTQSPAQTTLHNLCV